MLHIYRVCVVLDTQTTDTRKHSCKMKNVTERIYMLNYEQQHLCICPLSGAFVPFIHSVSEMHSMYIRLLIVWKR